MHRRRFIRGGLVWGAALCTVLIPGLNGDDAALEDRIDSSLLPSSSVGEQEEVPEGDYKLIIGLRQLKMHVYKGSKIMREFPVAVGAFETPTPIGEYFIHSKVKDPAWQFPERMLSLWKDYPSGEIPADDPRNPLKLYWIELKEVNNPRKEISFGIHGTKNPDSIPDWVSLGCIRMKDDGILYIAENVPLRSRVSIRRYLPGQEPNYANLIK